MTTPSGVSPANGPVSEAAERQYLMLCLLALLGVVGALVQYDKGAWAFLPFGVGGLALMANWSAGPPLLVLSVACLLPVRFFGAAAFSSGARAGRDPLNDFLLCAGMLAYCAGQYRLQSLSRWVFPVEPRPVDLRPVGVGGGRPRRLPPRKRSAVLVNASEVTRLALSLPIWCGLAFAIWRMLPGVNGPEWSGWRGITVALVALLGAGLAWAVIGHLGRSRAKPDEALIYLQDQVWLGTLREQGRVQRWLVRARLRRQRREER